MSSTTLFYILISVLVISFIIDKILETLNARHFNDEIPTELADIYDTNEYRKSQDYKKANGQFSKITSTFSFVVTLVFFFADGFKYIDYFARNFTDNSILVALIFFGIIMLGSDFLTTPFSYYQTFVIEKKFGFNKSTKKIFWLDKLKGWLISILIGGGVLAIIMWF